jgi:hypothetical protein
MSRLTKIHRQQSSDVASAAVDWSEMSGSSSSSPPRGAEVLSSRQPPMAARDKKVGSSSRQAARPAQEGQRAVRPRVTPSGTGTPELQRTAPRQADPREGQRSGRLSPASFMMVPTAPTRTPYRGVDHDGSRRTRRQRRACRRRGVWRRPAAPAVITYPGAEPQTSMFPSSPTGAKDQFRLSSGSRG